MSARAERSARAVETLIAASAFTAIAAASPLLLAWAAGHPAPVHPVQSAAAAFMASVPMWWFSVSGAARSPAVGACVGAAIVVLAHGLLPLVLFLPGPELPPSYLTLAKDLGKLSIGFVVFGIPISGWLTLPLGVGAGGILCWLQSRRSPVAR